MKLLQGNTYKLELELFTDNGEAIPIAKVNQVQILLGKIEKFYKANGTGEVIIENGKFIIPLEQEDTFALNSPFEWEARVLFNDGQVDGTGKQKGVIAYSSTKKILTLEG